MRQTSPGKSEEEALRKTTATMNVEIEMTFVFSSTTLTSHSLKEADYLEVIRNKAPTKCLLIEE